METKAILFDEVGLILILGRNLPAETALNEVYKSKIVEKIKIVHLEN